jgi:hypothetical protein
LQFGSSIKLLGASVLIFASIFIVTQSNSNYKKSTVLFLSLLALFPICLSLLSTNSFSNFNFIQYSNFVFLVFIYISFKEDLLNTVLHSFTISLFFLLPLVFLLKSDNIFGEPAGNANCLAGVISVGVLSASYLIYVNKISSLFKLSAYFLILSSIVVLYEIKSRGSLLLLLAATISMFILHLYKILYFKITKNHYICFFVIFALAVISLLFISYHIDSNNYLNFAYRENLLKAGLKIFQDNWMLGIGNGNLGKVLPLYWDLNTSLLSGAGETEYHLHNEYLNKGVEEGLLSFFLFLSLIAISVINGVRFFLFSSSKNAILSLPIIGVFLGVCVQILFDRILQFPTTGLLFALLCGILLSLNDNLNAKAFKFSKILITVLAILHFILIYPFLSQQELYSNSFNYSKNSEQKFVELIKEFSHETNSDDFRRIVLKQLDKYPKSPLKLKSINMLILNSEINTSIISAYSTIIIDLDLNWSKNLEEILETTQFPDLKVMTYKKYIELLFQEKRNEEALKITEKMYQEFPLILVSTYIRYSYYCSIHEFSKGLECLKKSAELTNDPKLRKKILLHQLKYENSYSFKEIEDCISLRRSIEYDPKYVKKNLVARFDSFELYYKEFILELFLKKDLDKGYALILDYSKLSHKAFFKEFINEIKAKYPEIYEKLKKEPLIEL